MQFESWNAFWEMGGYGFYVWLAFAVTVVAMLGIVAESIFARRTLATEVQKAFARRERIKAARRKEQSTKSQQESADL